jgi:hypothetical protein
MGYGGYAQPRSGGFSFGGFIVSVVSGAIFFGLYAFITFELLIGGGIQDINLYLIITAVLYTIALALTGVVLVQTLKPMSMTTMLMVALVAGLTALGFSLITTTMSDYNTELLLDWVRRVLTAVLVAVILSNFNKVFGANGEPRLSFVFMMIVILGWIGIDWGAVAILDIITVSDGRLIAILISASRGVATVALLYISLKLSNSPLQKGGGQMMYQQQPQPPYGQYPPYR